MKNIFIISVAVCLLYSCAENEKPPFSSDIFKTVFTGNVIETVYIEHDNPLGAYEGNNIYDWVEKRIIVENSTGIQEFNVINLYDYADALQDRVLEKEALSAASRRTWVQNLFYNPQKEFYDYLKKKKRTQIIHGQTIFVYQDISGYYFLSSRELYDRDKREIYEMMY
ncbi:MAG: hypothetical protein LBP85_05570 [Prevotellaceae bacterium]|jgi:hypothetical protein|nr:hypothetical protein [Prevotellaceae bacterium]